MIYLSYWFNLDRDWENARAVYEEELAGMKTLRQNVSRALAKLRLETEKLQREDDVMRDQEAKLRESYKQLEDTQTQYRTKGSYRSNHDVPQIC